LDFLEILLFNLQIIIHSQYKNPNNQKKSQKPFWQSLSKLLLNSKQRIYMEATHLRQNLIESITALPTDMLEELYKFINFLEYKKLSASDDNKDEILKNFKTSLKEMQMIKEKKLQARSADEFLDEL
jgi:hypothetical protein